MKIKGEIEMQNPYPYIEFEHIHDVKFNGKFSHTCMWVHLSHKKCTCLNFPFDNVLTEEQVFHLSQITGFEIPAKGVK